MRIYRMEPPVSAPDPSPLVNRDRAMGIIATAILFLPGMLLQPGPAIVNLRGADKAASSLGHAVQICLDLHREPTQT
jgi:hypothetical protein